MRLIYTLFVRIYYFFVLIASIGNRKAKQWITGRKNWDSKLRSQHIQGEVYWFHCASLGEFEQGRPLMEALKEKNEKIFLLVSFFSPSGYEIRKNTDIADYVCYLPLDTLSNARKFINILQPKKVFFVKYEFWFNFLNVLKTNKIPTYLVSGIFRKDQHFFKWYGSWFKNQLKSFNYFFLQNDTAKKLLSQIGYKNSEVTGDTRFDRVRKIMSQPTKIEFLEKRKDSRDLIIIGSNWPEDDEILFPFINNSINKFQFVIAPHNIKSEHLNNLESSIKARIVRLSKVKESESDNWDVLIIDSIGKLSSIYQYGKIAYIGGGFGSNVHNILEAATYGLPTIFGPNYHKFEECHELMALKAAFSIKNSKELIQTVNSLENDAIYEVTSKEASQYVKDKSGSTEKILNKLSVL